MYNQLHGLPENTTFEPSNGGTIEERSKPLYSNKIDRYTTETARGQELARMANTFKSAASLALTGLTGNWLWNGLRTAPLLTAAEFAGGVAGGSIGAKIGEVLDKAGLENPILNAKETLGFLGAGAGIAGTKIGTSKGAQYLINNGILGYKDIPVSISLSGLNPHMSSAQVKYYGPTMGKSFAAKTNDNLIDLDT